MGWGFLASHRCKTNTSLHLQILLFDSLVFSSKGHPSNQNNDRPESGSASRQGDFADRSFVAIHRLIHRSCFELSAWVCWDISNMFYCCHSLESTPPRSLPDVCRTHPGRPMLVLSVNEVQCIIYSDLSTQGWYTVAGRVEKLHQSTLFCYLNLLLCVDGIRNGSAWVPFGALWPLSIGLIIIISFKGRNPSL